VVSQPNALCSESGNLLVLYSNYNIDESYGSGTSAILVADLGGPAEFTFVPATLRRSALVTFSFELMSPGSSETLNVSQEVQIRNVP
jgi:MSHA biogenesis protein MshO